MSDEENCEWERNYSEENSESQYESVLDEEDHGSFEETSSGDGNLSNPRQDEEPPEREFLQEFGYRKLCDVTYPPLEDVDIAHTIRRQTEFFPRKPQLPDYIPFTTSPQKPPVHALAWRESGVLCGKFSDCQRSHLGSQLLPENPKRLIDQRQSRAYIGQFSRDGSLFVAAFQDKRICIYDAENGFCLRKHVTARNLRWTVTDTCLSPDQNLLIYATINSSIHVVNVGCRADGIYSVANVTDIHEEMRLGEEHEFGVWSARWSPDGKELVAGTTDSSLVVYDVGAAKTFATVYGHEDDINAVAYLDDSPNLIVTGSDDSNCKVWDRRNLRRSAGALLGHTEGVTFISGKGDGRHFISNAKDQTIKLWDLRKMSPANQHNMERQPINLPLFHWDYRWMDYPGKGFDIRHPFDTSLFTYRGHSVLQTLVRCYFSPGYTGQKYIYTGSANGTIICFSIATGEQVFQLQGPEDVVRDCSWNPNYPQLVGVSWDGTIREWSH
uniref:WD repeat-containing protein 23 n=1 Tax=Tetraselmis sp. GSL018 TaxID=582737 RepID=A0A061S995_9CHLO|mmetsp:Transcript_37921/g.90065  ORF Transcript_37921/g.90065 Transcript_37921/m.90065 type:complete len:497 (-) Transcript_37921:272-1762(-)